MHDKDKKSKIEMSNEYDNRKLFILTINKQLNIFIYCYCEFNIIILISGHKYINLRTNQKNESDYKDFQKKENESSNL